MSRRKGMRNIGTYTQFRLRRISDGICWHGGLRVTEVLYSKHIVEMLSTTLALEVHAGSLSITGCFEIILKCRLLQYILCLGSVFERMRTGLSAR